jgi:hypothetical protein
MEFLNNAAMAIGYWFVGSIVIAGAWVLLNHLDRKRSIARNLSTMEMLAGEDRIEDLDAKRTESKYPRHWN